MTEPIKVYIVIIETDAEGPGSSTPYFKTQIGAAYPDYQAAVDESVRLEAANGWTCAHVVCRELEAAPIKQPTNWPPGVMLSYDPGPMTICCRRAGKTRATFRILMQQCSRLDGSEIDDLCEEIFDTGPEI